MVIRDSTSADSSGRAISPDVRPLIMIAGSTNGTGRAALDTVVRYMAAATWLDQYTAQWRESVVGGDVSRGVIPDWLRIGAVAAIGDAGEPLRSELYMRANLSRAIPLRGLFSLRTRADDDLTMVSAEATSVLTYLRTMEGVEGTRDLLGLLTTGLDIDSALAAMPRATTVEGLELAWRAWLSGKSNSAVR
jgi:hypothetical protein